MTGFSTNAGTTWIMFMCLAIVVMFTSESKVLLENLSLLLTVFISLIVSFLLLLAVSQTASKMLKFPYVDHTALTIE